VIQVLIDQLDQLDHNDQQVLIEMIEYHLLQNELMTLEQLM
jgi:hypothetical protein